MTKTEQGICADTVVSCKDLLPCESDNKTCIHPNTICVGYTRCRIPVCYPIDYTSSDRCPPVTSRTSILTIGPTIPLLTTNLASSTTATTSNSVTSTTAYVPS
ncbi:unnamed protein product, partial [Rotaria magnacalcarata]